MKFYFFLGYMNSKLCIKLRNVTYLKQLLLKIDVNIYKQSSISEEKVLPVTKINSNFTVSHFIIPVDSQIPGPYFIHWNVDNTNIVKSFNFTILCLFSKF